MFIDLEPVGEKIQTLKGEVSKVAIDGLFNGLEAIGAVDKFGDLVNERVPGIINVQWIIPGSKEKFIKLTEEGFIPLGFAGHFVWYDAVLASEVCSTLQLLAQRQGLGDNIRGFALTLARSVAEGQQSRFMKAIYPKMEEFANARNVEFIPITRKKDGKYGMLTGLNLEEKRPLVSMFRQRGIGGMIFPGGSVEPGRHPKDGTRDDINGLQEITDSDLWDVFELMERLGQRHTGQEPYFLPMGINRGYRLQSPESKLPTPEGVVSLFDGLSDVLQKSVGFRRVIADINIGMPQTLNDIIVALGSEWEGRVRNRKNTSEWDKAILKLNTYLMKQVADLLEEPQARGFYGNKRY